MNKKLLPALAYILFVPALYIVLTDRRKDPFDGYHAGQALILWVGIALLFLGLRFMIRLLWYFIYIPYLDWLEYAAFIVMWGYAVKCGLRVLHGEVFKLIT